MSDLLRKAMGVLTQGEANAVLSLYVDRLLADQPSLEPRTAEYNARQNIAFFAGKQSPEDRDRVERLFGTAHPIYGAVRYNGPPTPEQVAKLGVEYGLAMRDKGRTGKDPREKVAELARVDCRREHRTCGIVTRAIGLDGRYDSFDIASLTMDSLLHFIRSRGGRNFFAEAIVLHVLGYEVPGYLTNQTLETGRPVSE